MIENHYDAVVIGSGFGGSVMAYRLAEAGLKVCVLEIGAKYIDNPIWYLKRTIAAHPLGGCPMGRNQDEGVVDSHGEVFNLSWREIPD